MRVGVGEMSGVEGRIAVARRFSMRLGDEIGFVSKSGGSDNADFEFLEDELDWLLENSCHDKVIGSREEEEEEEEEEEGGESSSVEESKAFWEAQQELLQAILSRRSSIEYAVQQAIKESNQTKTQCICEKPIKGECRNCLLKHICNQLRVVGFDCAICKSKRSSSFETPSEHIYLDVLGKSSSSSKRSDVRRVVIELNFRAEFEMARASEEYKRLVDSLPRVFVGKPSKLVGVIKIMCSAAKKCMKNNKMHMGPWRKIKYMEAKWLGSYRRMTPSSYVSLFSKGFADQLVKPKASMLTIDLHCTAVEVL